MVDALPLRVFLATPSDLESEREVVRTCVAEHNERNQSGSGITFEVIGWESVRGTAQRPQSAINELVAESHFLIALFKKSWGSKPGSSWGFTSGTEEELFMGLLELGRAEQPMRDIWLVFVDESEPAPEIVDLRRRLSDAHAVLYESVANGADLKTKLTERLAAWEPIAEGKVARHVDLLSSSGRDILGAQRLRLRGEKLVELGQAEAGLAALKEAAVLGGPIEHLSHARFLSRSGDLASAHAAVERAIEHFTGGDADLYSPLAAEAFAAQATLLRRQGLDLDAIGRLEHALTLVGEGDAYARKVRCRIFDELGLAHQNKGDLASASEAFESALEVRRRSGSDADVCQSLINLARLAVKADKLQEAVANAEEVVGRLRSTPPTALHANAELLVAQVRLRQGTPGDGLPHAERSLSLNRQLGSRRGEAMSLLLLAQCHRAAGAELDATKFAQACLEINESIGDQQGAKQAQWILDEIGMKTA